MYKFFFLIITLTFCFQSEASVFKTESNNSELLYRDRYEIYNSINFGSNPIDQQVFNYAFKGYFNLKDRNKIEKNNILSIIDYSKSSVEKRFWVMDIKSRQLLYNEWVSHGKYSGNATTTSSFSNTVNSKKSSIGFFVTGHTYDGKHKYSLKLHGMEANYNSNAFRRGIVIHGADYVSEDFIKKNNSLGRSYGCPAIRQDVKYDLISTIKDGSCLFSYYPTNSYLSNSPLLTKEVN